MLIIPAFHHVYKHFIVILTSYSLSCVHDIFYHQPLGNGITIFVDENHIIFGLLVN